jgi:hypothetical protein
MGVVRAPVQTVEEIYRLVWAAVANKQPIEAVYQGRLRLFCPHRLGAESGRTAARALLPVWRRQRDRTPASWLAGKLALYGPGEAQQGEVNGRCLAHGAESFAPNLMRGRKPISMPRIIRSAIRKTGTEAVAAAADAPERYAASRWSADYGALGVGHERSPKPTAYPGQG